MAKKMLILLKDIINSHNEYRPSMSDKSWVAIDDYYIIPNSKHYNINEKLVKVINKYSKIYLSLKNKDNIVDKLDDNVAIVYLLENDRTSEQYIGYTTIPLYVFIKLNIHNKNIDQDSVFDNFKDDDLTGFMFEIIEYVKFNRRKNIIDRKNYHKEVITGINGKTQIGGEIKQDDSLDKIYDKRVSIYFEVLGGQVSQFKSFTGYAHMLTNIINNKIFIGGYHKKLTKNRLLDMLGTNKSLNKLNKDISDNGRRNIKLDIIEEYDAKTLFDFLLRIDYHKIKFNSIEEGYNNGYSLEESELLFGKKLLTRKKNIASRNLFLKIQRYLFEKNFNDKTNYDNVYGIVYQIQHIKSKKRYISYNHMIKLKDILIGMYDEAIKGNVKHSKILKSFENEPYDSFTFKVLKKKMMNDHRVDPEVETKNLILKYDSINTGYNTTGSLRRRR